MKEITCKSFFSILLSCVCYFCCCCRNSKKKKKEIKLNCQQFSKLMQVGKRNLKLNLKKEKCWKAWLCAGKQQRTFWNFEISFCVSFMCEKLQSHVNWYNPLPWGILQWEQRNRILDIWRVCLNHSKFHYFHK